MDQLSLFSGRDDPDLVQGVTSSERHIAIADRLSSYLYMGTSSWSFPGWEGIVYDRKATQRTLARHGLKAYATHPLLRCVGVDRTYYAPITLDEFAAYANVVPETFRFIVKAHELTTRAYIRSPSSGSKPYQNAHFLDPRYSVDEVVQPCVEGLREKLGVLLFQFPPQSMKSLGGSKGFVERLHRFLEALPKGPVYAVEIRNSEILGPAYFQVLRDNGACHCFNVHPTMPSLKEQVDLTEVDSFPILFVRWMLKRDCTYEEAREAFAPFNRLAAGDDESRRQIAALCRKAGSQRKTAYVVVNNKAEGSAPLSVFKLAEELAAG
jgi:uncharacterized protein YecE (DUF72 family)